MLRKNIKLHSQFYYKKWNNNANKHINIQQLMQFSTFSENEKSNNDNSYNETQYKIKRQ